jgi:hypothetical protein
MIEMIEPTSILVIIAASCFVKIMIGWIVVSGLLVLFLGVAIAMGATE